MRVRSAGRHATVLSVCALGFLLAAADPASAAYGCSAAQNESHTDYRGWSWSRVWYCNNTRGAQMYADANRGTYIGWMDTTYSWFVCWRRGASHEGGNNVWYYSQGDRSRSGYEARHAWGFMPAIDVSTTVDPHPEIPQCPAEQSGPTPPKNIPLAFQNVANRTWVMTERGYTGNDYGMLRARGQLHGAWEVFTVVDAGGGAAALRGSSGQYVTVELNRTGADYGMLRARATAIGPWERFIFTYLGGERWTIRSEANGLYVSAELGYAGGDYAMLRARASSVGDRERFQFVRHQTRSDGLSKPIYILHGYDDGTLWGDLGDQCSKMASIKSAFAANDGFPRATGERRTVGFYYHDVGTGCDTMMHHPDNSSTLANHDTPIQELGRWFAWKIYREYSQFGVTVDVVAHSMGGLIARAALTGTQQNLAGWPPFVFVEDVVTLLSPHGGTETACFCGTEQCAQMCPNSGFLIWLDDNPQSDIGTDWTLFGADDDNTVPAPKAINMPYAGHYVVYHTGGDYRVEHTDIPHLNTGLYRLKYWDYFDPRWITTEDGYAPLVWARFAAAYHGGW